ADDELVSRVVAFEVVSCQIDDVVDLQVRLADRSAEIDAVVRRQRGSRRQQRDRRQDRFTHIASMDEKAATGYRDSSAGSSHRLQCASSQLSPTPMSTFKVVRSCAAALIRPRTRVLTSSTASCCTSNTNSSCTCMMSRAATADSASQRSTAIMARLMISAAVPCMGALMAARSAAWRKALFREAMSFK